MRMLSKLFFICLVFFALAISAAAENTLPPDIAEEIDAAAADALRATGVPAASVAVVKDRRIAFVKAYGNAKLEPATPATPEMRFSIGSVSKQFTATAILMLQEEGKLSLDDKVGKYLPDLHAGKRGYDPAAPIAHVRLSGLLAAGLCYARMLKPVDADEDIGPMGEDTARLRTRHEMAVQQY